MSFFVNNVELKEASFNQQEVKSIYFNTHLIWESFRWPGWANATWEDIYNLCKQKQEGKITAWPDDVVLGAEKTTYFSTSIATDNDMDMVVIGIDIDGPGIITFNTKYVLSDIIKFYDDLNTYNNFYNYCDAKPYIKSLRKGTAAHNSSRNGAVTYTDSYVWGFSEREIGIDKFSSLSVANSTLTKAECTYGVNQPYPYFNSNERRHKKRKDGISANYVATRSISNNYSYKGVVIFRFDEIIGVTTAQDRDSWIYLSPCFAIG